ELLELARLRVEVRDEVSFLADEPDLAVRRGEWIAHAGLGIERRVPCLGVGVRGARLPRRLRSSDEWNGDRQQNCNTIGAHHGLQGWSGTYNILRSRRATIFGASERRMSSPLATMRLTVA